LVGQAVILEALVPFWHHHVMGTIAERILDAIRFRPLDDDQLAKRLGVNQRQSINQTARKLAAQGRLRRYTGLDGKIVNALPNAPAPEPSASTLVTAGTAASGNPSLSAELTSVITEDEVKAAVRDYLMAEGFDVTVAWGHQPGIDLAASHPDGQRYIIEAKAEKGVTGPQQHNYFVGVLGELVQRMTDADAAYAIALPENRQYRGLVARLPALARERLRLQVFWVARASDGFRVTLEE
jgi:hypothetical protein